MLFLIFLVIMLIMLLAATIVGRGVSKLLPYRLRPIGLFYFSPLFGVGVFVLIATITGWIIPFSQWLSLLQLLVAVGISIFFLRKDLKLPPLVRYSVLLFAFSLIASFAISSSLIRFDAYNPFDDTFTYLVHGQWLQDHAFSERITGSGYYPALSQVALYQASGSRMGGSFFLSWIQAIFGFKWSYYVYPAAIAIPFVAGSLAISGAINIVVRGSRKITFMTGLVAATFFSGLTYGVTNGFFPQTFGLAFAIGAITLFAALINEKPRIRIFKKLFINAIPISILFGGLVFCYNDMLPFVVLALFGYLFLTIVFSRFKAKGALLSSIVIIFQSVLIINLEFARVLKNAVGVLMVGQGKYDIGYPIPWNPFEFLAFSFGFGKTFTDYWPFGKFIFPFLFIIVLFGTLYFTFLKFKQNLANPLLIHISILLFFVVTFFYFRYGSEAVHPNEIGHTFLQFKVAKWASPFAFVLLGSAIAYFSKRYGAKVFIAFLSAMMILSAIVHLDSARNMMQGFLGETGYNRSPFNALLRLREKVRNINSNEIIYLNFGAEHHKMRQMVAYILSDRKLASDYTDDGYILGHLPPEQQKMPFDIADWVIEKANPQESISNRGTGNIVLKKTSEVVGFSQNKVNGGYQRETDGTNWWYWTAKSLVFEYQSLTEEIKEKKVILRFSYLSATAGNLKITVTGKEVVKFRMAGGWQEFISNPIDVNYDKLVIEFSSDGEPVQASDADPRMVSFLVKNLELVNVR